MGATVLDMSMSLDGFIAGPHDGPTNGLGDGGMRLHRWCLGADGVPSDLEFAPADHRAWEQMLATGAVLVGRKTLDPAGAWEGDHHDGVPVVVVSRRPLPEEFAEYPLLSVESDLHRAVAAARRAAGDRPVLVHGARLARRMLRAGLLDEIHLHLVPVLLGDGRSLFKKLRIDPVELTLQSAAEGAEVTHLRFRVDGSVSDG